MAKENLNDPNILKRKIQELNDQLQSVGLGNKNIAKDIAEAGNEVSKLRELYIALNEELNDQLGTLNRIYRTNQDISAELKNQNILTKVANKLFNDITDIAGKLKYQQELITALSDKELKNIRKKIDTSKDDLKFIKQKFSLEEDLTNLDEIRNKRLIEINKLENRINTETNKGAKANKALIKALNEKLNSQRKELITLDEIEELQVRTIPILERNLELSKTLTNVQRDSLGIMGNTSKFLQSLLGPVAQYLNLSEAIEKSQDYINKKIKDTLESEGVRKAILEEQAKQKDLQDEILDNEEKLAKLKEIDTKTGEGINEELAKELDLRDKNGNLLKGQAAAKKYGDSLEAKIAAHKIALQEQIKNKQEEINASQEEEIAIKERAIKSIDNNFTRLSVMFKMLKEGGKGLWKTLNDPAVLVGVMVSEAKKLDNELTQFQRTLKLSREEAKELRVELTFAALQTHNNLINTHDLAKAQANFNALLHVQGNINEENLVTQVELFKLLKISEESASRLQFFSEATGRNFQQQKLDSYEITSALESQYGIHIDQKQVMEEVGKQGAFALVQFKGSTVALTEAVAKAKALGLALEDVRQVAAGLLDFESSISAEFEAELLTGKQINLERARLLALTNDQVGLMDELASQQITLNDFQNMNLIQQQSLAKSLGLSTDKLSDMLLMEEYRNMNYEQINALAGEDIAKRVETLTIQERFNEAIIKAQSLLGDLAQGPLGKVLDIMGAILESSFGLYAILTAIALKQVFAIGIGLLQTIEYLATNTALSSARLAIESNITRQKVAQNALDRQGLAYGLRSLGILASKAALWALANPIKAIAGIAAAAIVGSIAYGIATKANDFMDVGKNNKIPGYGKRTLFGPEGSIQFNDNDTIIAGTNLGAPTNNQNNSNNREMIGLLKQIAENQTKSIYIENKMDSKTFGGNEVLGKAMALGPKSSAFA